MEPWSIGFFPITPTLLYSTTPKLTESDTALIKWVIKAMAKYFGQV
jgi:pantothenate kinase-related protein Tda10